MKHLILLTTIALHFLVGIAFAQNTDTDTGFFSDNPYGLFKPWLFAGVSVETSENPYTEKTAESGPGALLFFQSRYLIAAGGDIYAPFPYFPFAGFKLNFRTDGAGSDQLKDDGIEERGSSLDGGVYLGIYGASISYITKLSGDHEGSEVIVDLGPSFSVGPMLVGPRISYRQKNKKLTQYYYGVSKKEAEKSIYSQYAPEASTVLNPGITLLWTLNPEWSVNLLYDQYHYSDEIKDSPIVRRNTWSAAIGVAYHFFGGY